MIPNLIGGADPVSLETRRARAAEVPRPRPAQPCPTCTIPGGHCAPAQAREVAAHLTTCADRIEGGDPA